MEIKHFTIIAIAVILFQSNYLPAQTSKVRDFKLTVKGTSTMHDWESTIQKIACNASYQVKKNELVDIKAANVKITVESIKSTEGKIMDNKTYDAFHSDKFPFITFILKSENINTSDLTVNLTGTLDMAGVTKQIDLIAIYKVLTNGDLQLIGDKKVKMTEFNMKPPKAMMGAIKVGDEVTISFDIILSDTSSIL